MGAAQFLESSNALQACARASAGGMAGGTALCMPHAAQRWLCNTAQHSVHSAPAWAASLGTWGRAPSSCLQGIRTGTSELTCENELSALQGHARLAPAGPGMHPSAAAKHANQPKQANQPISP